MGFRNIAAGKTGTTNDTRDAWFSGFTPKTLTLTWIGFDDNTPTGLSGGQGAAPIWTRYMLATTQGQPNVDFPMPPGIAIVAIDETSGGLATPYCPANFVVNTAFKQGLQPTQPCPLHSPQAAPPPAVDQFGNPIQLDTTGATTTDATGTQAPPTPPPAPPPVVPEHTLTGGVFKTETAGTTTQPPPTDTTGTNPPR